jgi:TPR repeat protein
MPRAFRVFALFAAFFATLCLAGCDSRPAAPADPQAQIAARALGGDPDAVAEIGRNYMTGASGYPIDEGKAREMFEFAAQRGSGAGLFYLGLLAYEASGRRPDIKEACGLFAQSAARGHPGGLREYGECQLAGTGGVTKDPRAAADSFRASIARGGVEAYGSLARQYASGEGVEKNPQEEVRLLRQRDALRGHR